MTTFPVKIDHKGLNENQLRAASLRKRFLDSGTLVLNIIGPLGTGKTSLLERTLAALPSDCWAAVLIGDSQTVADRRRLTRFGFPVKQAAIGGVCHLDAGMVELGIEDWELNEVDLLLIENASNLVCPQRYDLGETAKIVILSVTESADEPLKYPSLFSASELTVLNKVDLLPFVHFPVAQAVANVHRIHPGMDVILTSCTSGEGLGDWRRWLNHRAAVLSGAAMSTV